MSEEKFETSRGKQIFVGAAIMFTLTVIVVGFLLGWRLIPGWVGESFGMLAGVMSTPFFMEGSFILLGLLIVISLNIWRRHNDGDEFVCLEIETPDVETGKRDAD